MDTPLPPSSQSSQIPMLIMRNRTALLGFILAAVRDHHDAEDILQEVCLIACEKSDQFEVGTNFLAWARAIAVNRIHVHRRGRKVIQVDSSVLDVLSKGSALLEQQDSNREARFEALRLCIENLQSKQRQLMQGKYGEQLSIEALAKRVGKNVDAAYKSLLRIRLSLKTCIERRLRTGGEL